MSLWNDLLENLNADKNLKRAAHEVSDTPTLELNKTKSLVAKSYLSGTLNKLTVGILSDFLKGEGKFVSGARKPQLIELVKEHFDTA